MPEAVRTDPLVDPGPACESFDGTVGGVAVHPLAVLAEEDRPPCSPVDVELDGSGGSGRQGDCRPFAALADDLQDMVTAFEAEVVDVSFERFGHAQPVQAEQ
jgi:hypothetical protein